MCDLADRLDVTGRRIVVLAGPGDRRDEDMRAIARAVAGRFDHYICRRDDGLRERAGRRGTADHAAALVAAGVPRSSDLGDAGRAGSDRRGAAHGPAGDLLLIFADALVRSWKQVIQFRPEGAPAAARAPAPVACGRGSGGAVIASSAPLRSPARSATSAASAMRREASEE